MRDIVSSSGTELDHIVYDSFGNIVTETNASNGDRFKYAGMEYDAIIGQYYDRARWYGPESGRFDSEDTTGFAAGDVNLFRYVGNSPTDGTDPQGTQEQDGSSSTQSQAPQPPPQPPASTSNSKSGWTQSQVKDALSLTSTGQKAWDYYQAHRPGTASKTTVYLYTTGPITTTYSDSKGQTIETASNYGMTTYSKDNKSSNVYISNLNTNSIDAAGTFVHEMTHAQGGNESEAREAELNYYIEISNSRGQNLIYQPYIDSGVVSKNSQNKYQYNGRASLSKFLNTLPGANSPPGTTRKTPYLNLNLGIILLNHSRSDL